MNEQLVKFWSIYDEYIQTGDKTLRKDLSELLAQVEEKGRVKQLFRPEKGWDRILAWQVLRKQGFLFPRNNHSFYLEEGEVLAWSPGPDRDIFLSRIPYSEEVSGYLLNPGNYCECGKRDMTDYEWDKFVDSHIFTDERGLYLPLYKVEVVKKFIFGFIDEAKEKVVSYLNDKIHNPYI